jgi:hypothetical protein
MVSERLGAGIDLPLREEHDFGKLAIRESVVQRDPAGSPLAFGAVADGEYRLRFPGLVTYAFRPSHGEIRFAADSGTTRAAVEHLLATAALPLLLQAAGYEALHASAIQTAAGVVAFCGFSGAGKTTVAYGLARRGHALWADDVVLLAPRLGRDVVKTVWAPQPVNLRTESAGFFGSGSEGAISAASGADDSLAAVVALDRHPQTAGQDSRLPLDSALTTILPHAFCVFAEEGRERRTVAAYLDLVARVPVFRFHPPAGFAGFDAALAQLESRLRDALGRL